MDRLKLDRKLNVENILSLDSKLNFSLLKPKINLLLSCCTMCVFRLIEKKPIFLVLGNVGSKKSFFGMSQISYFNRYFHLKRKKRYIISLSLPFLVERSQILKLAY